MFGSKQKRRPHSKLNINCNCTAIEASTSIRYIGVTIDQYLSFGYMADSVIQKANARLKFLYCKMIPKKLLVNSLIQCHFDYACCVWYNGLTQVLKNNLQTTQNKMMRFVLNLDSRDILALPILNPLIGYQFVKELNKLFYVMF